MSGSLLSLTLRTEICGQDEEPVPFPAGEQSGNLPAVSTRRSKCCPRRQLPEWGWGGPAFTPQQRTQFLNRMASYKLLGYLASCELTQQPNLYFSE